VSETVAAEGLLGRVIDPLAAPPAWLQACATRLLARRETFPNALLVSGTSGAILTRLTESLAAGLLCDSPDATGAVCGACAACHLLAAGNHPDLLWLSPGQGDEAAGRKPSSQIRIEAVRELLGTLALSPHHGAQRVTVIEPAEAMNPATANALLKVLEEPPPGNVLVLVSLRPMRLLATIRSRCLQLRLSPPAGVPADTAVDSADAALAAFLRDPVPEAPARDVWQAQSLLLDALGRGAALAVPAASRISGLTLPAALDGLSRWVHDVARAKSGAVPRFLPDRAAALAKVAASADLHGLLHMAQRLAQWQRYAYHPLLATLTVADILLEYRAELFPSPRKAP
jgi:DNA polymerase-3 subunit delta'